MRKLARWLLAPYLNVTEQAPETSPLHAQGLFYYWNSAIGSNQSKFRLQRSFLPGFLEDLSQLFNLSNVNPLSSTEYWPRIELLINNWFELPIWTKLRLANLLHALCQYDLIVERTADLAGKPFTGDEDLDKLKYVRASAQFLSLLKPERPRPGYSYCHFGW